MKLIQEQKITGVTSTSTAVQFPASNLLDNHPTRPWKSADANQATLTFSIAAGTTGLAIFRTNAERAVCNLSDPNALTWGNTNWGNVDWPTIELNTTTQIITMGGATAIWVEFEESSVSLDCDVTLTNEQETVYAGAAVGGVVEDFTDPQFGLTENRTPKSILIEMSAGNVWGKKRASKKGFNGQFTALRAECWSFMSIFDDADVVDPIAWKVTDLSDNEWCIFGRFQASPTINHEYPRHSTVQFQLLEAF